MRILSQKHTISLLIIRSDICDPCSIRNRINTRIQKQNTDMRPQKQFICCRYELQNRAFHVKHFKTFQQNNQFVRIVVN